MARLTVTVGELTVKAEDHSPWLSRWRLRAWAKVAYEVLDRVAVVEMGEVLSDTQIADPDEPDCDCDEDECDCKVEAPRPSIGFRSPLPGGK